MKQYLFHLKVLTNEIFFGIFSFLLACCVLFVLKKIWFDSKLYFLQLFTQILEIIIIMYVVRNIMPKVPGIFKVPFKKDKTLISATVLLLVDWSKLDEFARKFGLR